MFQHVLQESLSPVHRTPLMWGGVCCVGVWWSHSTWGGGGLACSVLPTFTTPQGGACRQSAFDVEWGVMCVFAVWSSWAGHWCVCSPPPPPPTHTRTTSSTTQNRSTLNMSHKTACMQTTSHCDNGIQFMQLSLIWLGYGPLSTSDGVLDDSVPFPISLQVALHLCSKLLKMEMGSSLR